MKRVLVIGAGLAGLWSAVAAARQRDLLELPSEELEILVLNSDPYHAIRVRNYEADLSDVRIPLAHLLDPIGAAWREAKVERIDHENRRVFVASPGEPRRIDYDRLVLAAGGPLVRPPIPGLAAHAFSVDTPADALKLHSHLDQLGGRGGVEGQFTAVVVGAGLVGIEIACELPSRLRACGAPSEAIRVILADHADHIGSTMGTDARPVIKEALQALEIETCTNVSVTSVDPRGVDLASGERIAASTVIWCGGMAADTLANNFTAVNRDRFGRLPVNSFMKLRGVDDVFAAGDIASAMVDDEHASVMSCQHGRPMGRFAGHNAVCDLMGVDPLPMQIDWYVTILDLGPWGALYSEGWDRRVVATGAEAKRTKQETNCRRIYPPRTRDRAAILNAGAPVIQAPPAKYLDHTH